MNEQHQENILLKSTDTFLLKFSSCSRRRARKSLQKYVFLMLIFALFSSIVFSSLVLAPAAHASTPDNYSGLVKCSGVVENSGEVQCNFQTFISTVQSLINWAFALSVPIAVAIFAYAGLLYMSGKDDNKKQARTIFLNVVIGFIIMLVAYVAVDTLVNWVVNPGSGATTFLGS